MPVRKRTALVSAILVFVCGIVFTVFQPAPGQFVPEPPIFSLARLLTPVEEESWNRPPPTAEDLGSVTFVNSQTGWAVGSGGTILRTTDGGQRWTKQANGTTNMLFSVTFQDAQTGWAVGRGGTIFRTTDGGQRWTQQGEYRRHPAPVLYVALIVAISLVWYGARINSKSEFSGIIDLANSDAPVGSLAEDRLGQLSLVKRLAGFIQNRNTSGPIVMTIQAPWGMGKSSVMRMLEDELRHNRAARTVWFNAWHHQKEDSLLAYLLETIQKESLPSWITPAGLRFRWNLVVHRLFADGNRLTLIIFGLLLVFHRMIANLFSSVAGITVPPAAAENWFQVGGSVILVPAALQILKAYKTNPEKLTGSTGDFLSTTGKSLLSLPSLVGKSDIRHEFARNLSDVVSALAPQRLVLFMDDLDRCRPDQVVQILECMNFLSSTAPVFIVVGADYDKVETLAGLHFESVAIADHLAQPTTTAFDPEEILQTAKLRTAYARRYMRKIINLRINLSRPSDNHQSEFVTKDHVPGRPARWPQAVVILGLLTFVGLGFFHEVRSLPEVSAPSKSAVAAPAGPGPNGGIPTPTPTPAPRTEPEKTAAASTPPESNPVATGEIPDNSTASQTPILAGVALIFVACTVFFLFSRPRVTEAARDSEAFIKALEANANQIWKKCDGSPREVRRLLNYLRLLAASSTRVRPPRANTLDRLPWRKAKMVAPVLTNVEKIRQADPDSFDAKLVNLALKPGTPSDNEEIQRYFEEQCRMLGLSPKTFRPDGEP